MKHGICEGLIEISVKQGEKHLAVGETISKILGALVSMGRQGK